MDGIQRRGLIPDVARGGVLLSALPGDNHALQDWLNGHAASPLVAIRQVADPIGFGVGFQPQAMLRWKAFESALPLKPRA